MIQHEGVSAGPEVAAPPCAECRTMRPKRCRPCSARWSAKWRRENPERVNAIQRASYHKNKAIRSAQKKIYLVSKVGRFKRYKDSAKSRGIQFELTFVEFIKLWNIPCHYCGGAITTIGIDRVDNTRGYSLGNIVSCCSRCNGAKSQMTCDQFVAMCRSVASHMEKSNARI